jgi:hypothetical protein
MEIIVLVLILLITSALVALLGRNRKIGYNRSLIFCIVFSPIIGIIIILLSKKNKAELVEIDQKGTG